MHNQKKSKGFNPLLVIVPLLVMAIGAGLVLIPSLISHNKAMAALDAGDLESAVAHFSEDYIFREDMLERTVTKLAQQYLEEDRAEETLELLTQHGMTRSQLYAAAQARLAEKLVEQGSFTEARVLLQKMGEEYRELWLAVNCAELKAEYQSGSEKTVLEKISQKKIPGFEAEDYQSAVLCEMMLGLANERIEGDSKEAVSRNWEAALQIVDAIPNRKTPGLNDFYQKYYSQDAIQRLSDGNWTDALEQFEKCGEYEPAKMCADVLKSVRDKDYLGALTAVNRLYEKYPDMIDKEVWQNLFSGADGSAADYADIDLNTLVMIHAEMCRFYETGCTTLKDAAGAFYETEYDHHFSAIAISDSSIDDIAKLCGGAASGKVLIVRQERSYSDVNLISHTVCFDWMSLLPGEYRPACLEEVEYLLVLNMDYDVRGSYTHGTKALREYGSVKLIQISQNKTMYQSRTIYGGEPPASLVSYGSAPEYTSGGKPNLKDSILQAFVAMSK